MSEAKLIDGKAHAAKIREVVARNVTAIEATTGKKPGLAVVIVGNDPASQIYVRNKIRQTKETGMVSIEHRLDEDTTEKALLALVDRLNNNPAVNGILVQLPLPKQIDEGAVIQAIAHEKDVDGFHLTNVGLLATGGQGMVPCTPLGCLLMLKDELGSLSGLNAIVVGRSNIVGKPMAQLLLKESCTVTIAHSRTQDLPGKCRESDILVAAVGVAHLVKGDWVKPGAAVIDVGQNVIPAPDKGEGKTRLVGDVDFSEAFKIAGSITPVPGGVGPMTIACLLQNTVTAFCRQNGLDEDSLG